MRRRSISRGAAALMLVGGLALSASPAAVAEGTRPLRLRFEGVVGDPPFHCGESYAGIGTTQSAITVSDFRFYVSRLRLLRADGTEVRVTLTADELWQHDDVALVDFEDGTKSCANGTPDTRGFIDGQVTVGTYVGVRFDLGIPFDKNHRDPTLQPSPLNLTRMFWNWNAGYKFLRIDLRSTGQPKGWSIHLGSTGCTPREGPTSVPTTCKAPNRLTVTLPEFDIERDVVRFDLKSLLADSDVDAAFGETGPGCMSGAADPECGPLFSRFGLPHGSAARVMPRVFSRASAPPRLSAGQP